MIPIVTPAEMAEVDATAVDPVDALIGRAGSAVAWAARRFLGGTYGRRIAVVAGSGHNGADGRIAAGLLRSWGARVREFQPDVAKLPDVDLVLDAAFGTGLNRPYRPPVTTAPVLAVDIPSGVDGLTGELLGASNRAALTVTFQALKPGLVFPPGSEYAGQVEVADLGLDVSAARSHLVESGDVVTWLPERTASHHKWRSACWVIAGSEGMTGAAVLTATSAANAGGGYVRLSSSTEVEAAPVEVVVRRLSGDDWSEHMTDAHRFGSIVIGPGLGRDPATKSNVLSLLNSVPVPVVVDADALVAVASDLEALRNRSGASILTPHDGEYEVLTGHRPQADRMSAACELAEATQSIVLLKGPATVVANPDGRTLVIRSGDQRLATAGTGDVLSGIIGALVAQGLDPWRAAAAGAWVHGQSAMMCRPHGMVASDLLTRIPEVINAAHLG